MFPPITGYNVMIVKSGEKSLIGLLFMYIYIYIYMYIYDIYSMLTGPIYKIWYLSFVSEDVI